VIDMSNDAEITDLLRISLCRLWCFG